MALKTLSDLVRYLMARGCDGAAALLFLLWKVEQDLRCELHAWKHALHTGYAWGQAFSGWGL